MPYPDAKCYPRPTRPRLHARKLAAHFPAHALVFTLSNGWSCMTSPRADSQNTAFRRPGALERQRPGAVRTGAPRRRSPAVASDTRWVFVFARAELRESEANRLLNLVSSALEEKWGEWLVVGDVDHWMYEVYVNFVEVYFCREEVQFGKQVFCSNPKFFLSELHTAAYRIIMGIID